MDVGGARWEVARPGWLTARSVECAGSSAAQGRVVGYVWLSRLVEPLGPSDRPLLYYTR
jgi:hypothetical protein